MYACMHMYFFFFCILFILFHLRKLYTLTNTCTYNTRTRWTSLHIFETFIFNILTTSAVQYYNYDYNCISFQWTCPTYICICMHVCMYACMHVCMYACMHVCMYACMHVCMYACMHVCMCACMHVCMYACVHVCMCACMHVCMYVCMYVCTEISVVWL